MTIRQFLRSLGSGATVLSLMASTAADEPLVTNVGRFEIPFDVDAEPGEAVAGYAVLFGSQDGGTSWEQLQTVPATQQGFEFSAPRDGHYAFAVRRMDAQGNLQEAINGARPELEIVVDTTAPELKLDLYEVSPGQVLLKWQSADSNLNPATLKLEFSEGGDGRWKSVRVTPAATGQFNLQITPGSVVAVRGVVSDHAGNAGQKTSQLVLKANSPATPVQEHTAAQSVAANALPMGPSPFSGAPRNNSFGGVHLPPSSQVPVVQQQLAGTEPPVVIEPSGQFNVPPAPVSQSMTQTPPTNSPAGQPSLPVPELPQASANSFAAQPASAHGSVDPFNAQHFTGAEGAQLVNSRVFEIDYQVEEVGPSGVGAVDLFVTEDGGQQWFRYGSDTDLRSPFEVDSMGEGTFGFAVRVRNGLGISDPPPQPGEVPIIVVTVDQTPPMIEFPVPTLRPDGSGSVQLSWKLSDANPVSQPVRLEFSPNSSGPWTPVFDWQPDSSGHVWTLRPGSPTSVYFRILARDAAGNVSSAQTAQPVVIDMKRPVARVLRVQSASARSTPTPGF